MDLHQNARLTFRSREALAKKVMIDRLTLNAAAAAFNVSRKTAAKWWARYRTLGVPGLRDRSSCPLHSPRRTPSDSTPQVIALRRDVRPAYTTAHAPPQPTSHSYHTSPPLHTLLPLYPATSVPLAPNTTTSPASPALTRPAPTARQNASSKPPCASGLTFATPSTQKNVISSFRPGSSITTSTVRMVVSVTLRPSAACLRWVQRLDRSQLAHSRYPQSSALTTKRCPLRSHSKRLRDNRAAVSHCASSRLLPPPPALSLTGRAVTHVPSP